MCRILVIAVSAVVAVLSGFTVHGFVLLAQRPDPFAHLVDPPAGPRAPLLDVLGLKVGKTTLKEVQVWADERGARCEDGATIAAQPPAHVTKAHDAAPVACPFKQDAGMQVRLVCDVDPARLGERFSETSDAELTLVFDSAAHPLRYVMVDRKLRSQAETHAEWTRATSTWHGLLGAPTASGDEPSLADTSQKAFPRFKLFRKEWRYADRRVEVQAMNFGPKRGIDVREVIEIPWPIRSK